jgi:transposase-like protein
MTEHSINLMEYLHKLALEPDADFLRESLKVVTELVMEAEVTQAVGARKSECSATATGNGPGKRGSGTSG